MNQSDPAQLTVYAFWLTENFFVAMLGACLWATLRVFVDGQTCLWQAQNICVHCWCAFRCFPSQQRRDSSKFVACSGSRILKGWLMNIPLNQTPRQCKSGREREDGISGWQNLAVSRHGRLGLQCWTGSGEIASQTNTALTNLPLKFVGIENHNNLHWTGQSTSMSKFSASRMTFSFMETLVSVIHSYSHIESSVTQCAHHMTQLWCGSTCTQRGTSPPTLSITVIERERRLLAPLRTVSAHTVTCLTWGRLCLKCDLSRACSTMKSQALMPWYGQVLSFKYSIRSFLSFHLPTVMAFGWVECSSITLSESVTQNMPQNFELHVSVEWESYEKHIKIAHKFSDSYSQTRLSIKEHTQRRPQTRSHIMKTFSNSKKGMNNQLCKIRLIRWLMFCKFFQRTRSKTLVSAHTPRTCAVMAAPTSRRSSILLIVTHFPGSTPLITIPQPLLRLSLKLPSQKPRVPFHVVRSSFSVDINLSPSLCACTSTVVCLLVMFSVDVLHKIVDVWDWRGNSSLPPWVSDPLNFLYCLYVLDHIAVSAELHSGSISSNVNRRIFVPNFWVSFLCPRLHFWFLLNFISGRTKVTWLTCTSPLVLFFILLISLARPTCEESAHVIHQSLTCWNMENNPKTHAIPAGIHAHHIHSDERTLKSPQIKVGWGIHWRRHNNKAYQPCSDQNLWPKTVPFSLQNQLHDCGSLPLGLPTWWVRNLLEDVRTACQPLQSFSNTATTASCAATTICGLFRKIICNNLLMHPKSYHVLLFFNICLHHNTVPCSITGFLSSCHSQCFCIMFIIITYKCWQLLPSNPPICNFFHFHGSFSFSNCSKRHDAHHFDITVCQNCCSVTSNPFGRGCIRLPSTTLGIHAHDTSETPRDSVNFLHGQTLGLTHDGIL